MGKESTTAGADAALVQTSGDHQLVGADALAVPEPTPAVRRGRLARLGERGMVSAEWAVGLIAAIAIAGVLVAVVTNGAVKRGLLQFILMVIEAFARHMGSA